MVKHIELGASYLGKPTHSRAGAYLWGGHAYRRGIVRHLATSGVEVSKIQSLLRRSCTSTAIIPVPWEIHIALLSKSCRGGGPGNNSKICQSGEQDLGSTTTLATSRSRRAADTTRSVGFSSARDHISPPPHKAQAAQTPCPTRQCHRQAHTPS
jgi:hypothetical protein